MLTHRLPIVLLALLMPFLAASWVAAESAAAIETPAGEADAPAQTPREPSMRLGMNLATPSYWSTNWIFGDVMLQATYVESAGGWLAFWDAPNYGADYPRSGFIAVPANGARVVDTGNGLRIKAREDARARGVQVWLPMAVRDQLFHPTFLDRLRPFKVLRFMDWLDTNGSDVVEWSDQGEHDVPIPYMTELCNELDADPWFCMPHAANDDYVRRFAELVKARLEPDRKIYLEYSNECWNAQFDQHRWLTERSGGKGAMAQAGIEAKRDFAIWYDVFGEEAPKRLIRVAAGQANNPWQIEQMIKTLGGDFDAVSCAAYAGISFEEARSFNDTTTAEEIIETARRQWRERLANRREHAAIAKAHGVRFVAYEGGQHLSPYGRNVSWRHAFAQAQRHPEMYRLYREILDDFQAMGGELFVAFNDVRRIDRNGAWGHLEYQNQPLEQAPKYRALLDFAAGRNEPEPSSATAASSSTAP